MLRTVIVIFFSNHVNYIEILFMRVISNVLIFVILGRHPAVSCLDAQTVTNYSQNIETSK
jgi:hypothetical protein